jgi:hypothetical protein
MILVPLKECWVCGVISRWEFTGFALQNYEVEHDDVGAPKGTGNLHDVVFIFSCRECAMPSSFMDLGLQHPATAQNIEGQVLTITKVGAER